MQADSVFHWLIRGIGGGIAMIESGISAGHNPGHTIGPELDNLIDRLQRIAAWRDGHEELPEVRHPGFDWKDPFTPSER